MSDKPTDDEILKVVAEGCEELFDRFDHHFDRIDAKLDVIEDQIHELTQTYSQIETKLAASRRDIEERLARWEPRE